VARVEGDEILDTESSALAADEAVIDALDQEPAVRDELQLTAEDVLGVSLGASQVRPGTDMWFVSAYAAVLWRTAVMAAWQDHPIAIEGALQGKDWVTVCVPVAPGPVPPAAMFRQVDFALLRPLHDPPVEFYVRRVEDRGVRRNEVDGLNNHFIDDPTASFPSGDIDTSVDSGWHRLDGLMRKHVILEPDAEATEHIRRSRSSLYANMHIAPPDLNLHPPSIEEYPDRWRGLLRVDEAQAIAALGSGADDYAAANTAIAQRAEEALRTNMRR
jgi:hypothetical protein